MQESSNLVDLKAYRLSVNLRRDATRRTRTYWHLGDLSQGSRGNRPVIALDGGPNLGGSQPLTPTDNSTNFAPLFATSVDHIT